MGQEHPPLHPLQRVPAPAVPPRCGPRRTVSRPFSFFLRSLAKKAAHTPHPAARLNTQATLTTRTSSGAAASSPARTSRAASRRTTMPLAGEKRRSEDRMHGAASAALRCAERKKGRGWGGGTRRACAVVGTRLALVRATLALTLPQTSALPCCLSVRIAATSDLTSIGSPSAVPVPCASMSETACGWADAFSSAARSSPCCA